MLPLSIGMHHYKRMMTSKSTPVVVTISPERIHIASTDQVFLDSEPAQLQAKKTKLVGAITIASRSEKMIVAAIGAATSGAFTQAQVTEIQQVQAAASQDPQASQLELARTLWVGQATSVNGSFSGSIASLKNHEAVDQNRIGTIVLEALTTMGVQTA